MLNASASGMSATLNARVDRWLPSAESTSSLPSSVRKNITAIRADPTAIPVTITLVDDAAEDDAAEDDAAETADDTEETTDDIEMDEVSKLLVAPRGGS